MPDLPPDLLRRLTDRAADPMRRTAMAGVEANAQPLDVTSLLNDLHRNGAAGTKGLGSAIGKLVGMFGGGGQVMMGPGGSTRPGGAAPKRQRPLQGPPGGDEITRAEKALGFTLPIEVRQLYQIGDGGFGPANGLLPLSELVHRYSSLTDEPYGPAGQDWPSNLLPLFDEDPVLICIDLKGGAIVVWDPEEIEDEDSDHDWQRSFKSEAANLAALLDVWLAKPTFEERHAKLHAEMRNDPMAIHVRNMIESLARMTPDERAVAGYPGEDWEHQVKSQFGQA